MPRLLHAADHHHLYRSHHELAASSIPHAEIESSAPYQPFHTDRRVALFEYGPGQSGFGGVFGGAPGGDSGSVVLTQRPWAFGQPIATVRLDVGPDHGGHDDDYEQQPVDQPGMAAAGPGGRALPAAAMERVTMRLGGGNAALHSGAGVDGGEQIVVTTRRRRGASRNNSTVDDDGFFEDDCEVLDFADQRV